MSTLFSSLAIAPLITHYGYLIIVPLSMFTGPIIGVIGGLLVSLGTLNWLVVFLALEAGDIFGDIVFYYLGHFGHEPFIQPVARWLGATAEGEARLAKAFERNATKVILLNKLNAAGAVVLYYAGAIRMPFGRYLFINAASSVPKVVLFEVVGYFFGQSYLQISRYLNIFGVFSLLIPVGLIAGYWYLGRYARRS